MIWIVWASFAWLAAYLTIKKRHPHQEVKLFDMRHNFTFIPSLHEALWSTKTLHRIQFSLKEHFGDDIIHEEIVDINEQWIITWRSWTKRACEYLIIATWSRTQFGPDPSFKKHWYTVRYPEDIPTLNNALLTAKNTTIIWWWYTGIEVASVLATRKLGGHIRLIHRDLWLLQVYSKKVWEMAKKYLINHKVEILFGKTATAIDAQSITLDDGTTLPSDVTIINTWIIINDEAHKPHLTFNNWENSYSARENERIFTCGDVAIHGLYTTAHNAYEEWKRVGTIISDSLAWKPKTYPPLTNYNKLALALGIHDGIFIVNTSWRYIPRLTWTIKRLIEKKIMWEFKNKILLPF
jgi:NADH dehydrogenase FAD-containing subunit